MRVGIVGAGRIGGNCARQFAKGGQEAKLSFPRDRSRLEALAAEIGDRASLGSPREATEFGEVVVFSVPWDSIDAALAEMGSLEPRPARVVAAPGLSCSVGFGQNRAHGGAGSQAARVGS